MVSERPSTENVLNNGSHLNEDRSILTVPVLICRITLTVKCGLLDLISSVALEYIAILERSWPQRWVACYLFPPACLSRVWLGVSHVLSAIVPILRQHLQTQLSYRTYKWGPRRDLELEETGLISKTEPKISNGHYRGTHIPPLNLVCELFSRPMWPSERKRCDPAITMNNDQ